MPSTPPWLTARPAAHRGLHDRVHGIVENTLPAFEAAIARGFAIEMDVQPTADGDAVVFHDHTLNRLTAGSGDVRDHTREALEAITVTGSGTTIPSLAKVLAQVDGRTPLLVELKSNFDGRLELADAVAGAVSAYSGPVALMSFDPALLARLRRHDLGCPLGIISASMGYEHWVHLSPWQSFVQGALLHRAALWCDFISYNHAHLPAVSPMLAKWLGRKALLCWTVKSADAAKRVSRYVDAITFEGFDPYSTPE